MQDYTVEFLLKIDRSYYYREKRLDIRRLKSLKDVDENDIILFVSSHYYHYFILNI